MKKNLKLSIKRAENLLKKFTFVQWDRFTNPTIGEYHFYGWIKRAKDSNKDFLIISYFTHDNFKWFITSSKKYSNKIAKILGHKIHPHAQCQRIEDFLNIKNVIHLKK